jgi:hypothetical protein
MAADQHQMRSDQQVSVNKRVRAFPSTRNTAPPKDTTALLTENRRSRVVSWLRDGPVETEQTKQSREDRILARQRSNQALHTCPGYTAIKQHIDQGGKLTADWCPSKLRSCPACRKWLVQRDVERYLRVIGNTAVVASTIDAGAWRTRKDRLDYAGEDHLQIKQPDGQVLVIATAGPGEVPADLEALLAGALTARPDGTKVTLSKQWAEALRKVDAPPADPKVQVIGVTRMPAAQVAAVARSLGLYVGALPGEYETHELRAITSRFVMAIGMRRTDRARWQDRVEQAA